MLLRKNKGFIFPLNEFRSRSVLFISSGSYEIPRMQTVYQDYTGFVKQSDCKTIERAFLNEMEVISR